MAGLLPLLGDGAKLILKGGDEVMTVTRQGDTVVTKKVDDVAGGATNGGVCSFHADTLVLTDDGLLPISDVNTNMSVWSRNPANGEMAWQSVQAQYSNTYEETVSVTMRDVETGVEQTIVSNRIHPYFVQTERAVANSSEGHVYAGPLENGHWVDAAELQVGDRLLNDDGSWAEVVSVEIEAEPLTAFNLTVADFHTYFVAANENAAPVWVHNDCFDWTPASNPNQLWSKGKLKEHYEKHGAEFGAATKQEYSQKALAFATNPPVGSVSIKTDVGQYIYDPSTRSIFVGSPSSGKIKTFYQWDGRANDAVVSALREAGKI